MNSKLDRILHDLVNEKVNVVDDGITSCCILEMVFWHEYTIYICLRDGFTTDEVLRIEYGQKLPVIYLRNSRKKTTLKDVLSKEELAAFYKHYNNES